MIIFGVCFVLLLQYLLGFQPFLLLIDVNEWINNERSECMLLYVNFSNWFTRSHPSKGEHYSRNGECKQAFKQITGYLVGSILDAAESRTSCSDQEKSPS